MTKAEKSAILSEHIIHNLSRTDKSAEGIFQRIMKIFRLLCLILCLSMCISAIPVCAQTYNSQIDPQGCHTPDAAQGMPNPTGLYLEATAALLYDAKTDTMIYMQSPDQRLYPTGLTAILTCLIALEEGDLDEIITVKYSVIKDTPEDSTTAELMDGEEIALRELLYCIMLNSAVDAALTVADHIGGSVDAFVEMMNRRAQELGCTATHFTNPTGLHNEDHYSTARDLLRITLAAIKNEDFCEIYSVLYHTVPETNLSESRTFVTTNYMVSGGMSGTYKDERVVGSKTGYTSRAGRCLMVTAEDKGMQYVGIVMGGKTTIDEPTGDITAFGHFEGMCKLLDYGFDNYKSTSVASSTMIAGTFPVQNGKNDVSVMSGSDIFVVLPKDVTYEQIRAEMSVSSSLSAPIAKGAVVGAMRIWYNNISLGQVDLIAAADVDLWYGNQVNTVQQQKETNRRTMQILGIAVVVLLSVLGLALAFMLISYARTAARRAARNARRKRRLQNRTRGR